MKVAVVGSGVSGLAATWLLNEHSPHEVHLFEADSRAGGHANTVLFTQPGIKGAPSVAVDTGFIVFNPSTYPNFLRFLAQYPALKGAIQETDMTFSVSRDGGAFEWAGVSLASVFCQRWRVFDRRMWRMLYDVVRFNVCAGRIFADKGQVEMSIGEYLEREGYSDAFRDDYLLPMTAAIWSTPPDKCALDFPARTLIQFMHNHHLLQLTGKPSWLTLRGGSRIYVDQILSKLPPPQLHLNTPIRAVSSAANTDGTYQVTLETDSGATEAFDRIILACHADTALGMLQSGGETTPEEERILGTFKFNKNEVALHADTRLMPKSRMAWSCWNNLAYTADGSSESVDQISLTYNMNLIQHIPEAKHGPILVTLNPPFEPDAAKTVARFKYEHPIIDAEAIRAQSEMPTIQNTRGISYAGAWMRYGFHEDGFTAGLRAALSLRGASRPKTDCMRADGQSTGDSSGERSVESPFDVQIVDNIPQAGFGAIVFDVLEGTRVSAVVGTLLGLALDVCSTLLVVLLVTFGRSRKD